MCVIEFKNKCGICTITFFVLCKNRYRWLRIAELRSSSFISSLTSDGMIAVFNFRNYFYFYSDLCFILFWISPAFTLSRTHTPACWNSEHFDQKTSLAFFYFIVIILLYFLIWLQRFILWVGTFLFLTSAATLKKRKCVGWQCLNSVVTTFDWWGVERIHFDHISRKRKLSKPFLGVYWCARTSNAVTQTII